eukprot:TRINITY_DN18563_c0_g1_i1.p1 TRINITY_DN18563_c0_g1~~TRINITY_DN18563_c0_g1_i1.p1  ORF type:complete len:175 (+),score=38.20 TRINITY_DN18563_c0_g1_i1:97-621(+)
MSLYTVSALLLLDLDGKRVAGKYYQKGRWETEEKRSTFEKLLRKKAQVGGHVMMIEECVVVYKEMGDVTAFVIGKKDENELILDSVASALCESLAILLRNEVHKLTILENFDYVLLIIDELIDGGVIMQQDPTEIAKKVTSRGEGETGIGSGNSGGAEKTILKALQTAHDLLMS